MAIKAAQILHDHAGYVINRIQSAGPGQVNVPEEKVYEVGNYQAVGTVLDNPDLSFDVESFSVNCEMEAICTGADPSTLGVDAEVDLSNAVPTDIISPFKSGNGAFDIVRGVVIPELMMERASYRFGLRQNATQQFTLRGDSIYYIPGSPYSQVITNTDSAAEYAVTNTQIAYTEGTTTGDAATDFAQATDEWTSGAAHGLNVGDVIVFTGSDTNPTEYSEGVPYYVIATPTSTTFQLSATEGGAVLDGTVDSAADSWTWVINTWYTLNVRAVDTTNNVTKRLRLHDDYVNTPTGFTLTTPADFPSSTYDEFHVVYGSTTAATYNQTVHNTTDPAAIRGKDIDLYVETAPASGIFSRWTTVQSVEINWSVSLEADEEFGSSKAVSRDFLVPEVSGSVSIRSEDPADLWSKIEQIANTPASQITGPLSSEALGIEIRLSDPATGSVIKTFQCTDAKFTVPAISARQQTKLDTTFSFTSEGGLLSVWNGKVV